MKTNRILAACLMLLLLGGCGKPEGAALGLPAPEISTLDLKDKQQRLSDYLGRVLVLNFWSGGCGPCIAEMPRMDSLYRQYDKDGLTVLGINQGEPPEAVKSTVKRVGVSYPIAIDQLGISAKRYNVFAVPATFILDREGVLRERVMGEISRDRLEDLVRPLLSVSGTTSPHAGHDTRTASLEAAPAAEKSH